MIHLDTNFLVRSLIDGTREQEVVDRWAAEAVPLGVSAPAWSEFLCGPVTVRQVGTAARLLGPPRSFTPSDAELAAELFNLGGRRRGTLVDCMIAATAIRHGAELATANVADFSRFAARGLALAPL